jgi:hypothetical protein
MVRPVSVIELEKVGVRSCSPSRLYVDHTEDREEEKQDGVRSREKQKITLEPNAQQEGVDSADGKLTLLTRLVEMMANELRDVKRDNEKLRDKVKRLKLGHQETKSHLTLLLASDRRRTQREEEEAKQRRNASVSSGLNYNNNFATTNGHPINYAAMMINRERAPSLSLMEVPALAYRHDSSSSSSSSPPSSAFPSVPASSFSYELAVLHGGLPTSVMIEVRHFMPFLTSYSFPHPFGITDFRFVCSFAHVRVMVCVCVCARWPCRMCLHARILNC